MITFEELKERTTPEIIEKMVELAEGFTYELYNDKSTKGRKKNIRREWIFLLKNNYLMEIMEYGLYKMQIFEKVEC